MRESSMPRSIVLLVAAAGALAAGLAATQSPTPPASTATPASAEPAGEVRYGTTPAPAHREGTLRLACYNVENLFDHIDDPAISGDIDDLPMATTDDRCRALAQAIRAVNADVICLEEVESRDALRWFRDTYLAGMGYDYIAADDVGYARGVEQTVLSRHPIIRQRVWPEADLTETMAKRSGEGWTAAREGSGERFQRSPLFVQVRHPSGYVLDLFVVHHKAGGKDYAFHREAEALQIISLVKERLAENPDANIAVVGDFNASPSDKSVKIYMDPEFGGLKNAWEDRFDRNLPREAFVTHASGRVIDFMFMSDGLKLDVVPKTFFILATLAPPKGWDWRTDPHPSGYASDHRPLSIDLVPEDGPTEHGANAETKLWNARPGDPAVPAVPAAPASPDVKTAPASVPPRAVE